ncbi:MAG: sigma 54-interacting transcriptional regulator [Clostridiales bacterium]|nr:sigma 54-interacting transcriptional regulator [Clostridiales bacterium]
MFSTDTNQKLHTAWERFLAGQKIDNNYIRKEILESWERSRNYGVNWDHADKELLSKKQLEKRIEERRDLYDTAIPVLEGIYKFTKGSSFIVILADEDGYVLKILGDSDIKAITDENRLVEGCNRSEEKLGTNAIGTCLYLKEPIQIWAGEHYYVHHRDKTCSGAPIFDTDGKLIGAVCLTGIYDKAHFHTLGMAVAASSAISKQLELKDAYNKILNVKNKLDVILETIPSGVILINRKYKITQMNSKAISYLHTRKESAIGQTITHFIKKEELDFSRLTKNIYDTEIEINIGTTSVNYSVSAVFADKSNIASSEIVVILKKVETVHRMANKIVGSRAPFIFDDIMGHSPEICEAKRLAKIASETSATVLLRGESGTGKELFAQSIHNMSSRRNGPFVAINCGSLPRSLIESELFGYTNGSFTGAKKEGQAGKFELANGGTIFLDEIGDMPADVQVSLLRVLQNREVTRIGSTRAIKIDVRIIAATNKNLEKSIADNTFRNDLYYRLNVFSIHIPPLRERQGDINYLSDYFFHKYKDFANKDISGISPDVYKALNKYTWPGNIRELENTIERALLISQHHVITIDDLPENFRETRPTYLSVRPLTGTFNSSNFMSPAPMENIEKESILEALNSTAGNVKKAAELLQMNRRTLYRKLEKFGIDYNSIRH